MKHLEETIQRYLVGRLHELEKSGLMSFEADMGGRLRNTRRQVEQAKQLGWRPGTMDMTLWFGPNGKAVRIELKAGTGRVKPSQDERQKLMEGLEIECHVLRASTGAEAWTLLCEIILPYLQIARSAQQMKLESGKQVWEKD